MIDCSCYHDEINFLGKRGVCWGTKERESCSCGGDAAKCDFYPTVREKGKKPQTNADKIRAMSDEELAEWMANKVDCQYCSVRSEWCTESEASCRTNWLDWLKRGGE